MDAEQIRQINATLIERYRAGDDDLGVPGMHRDRIALLTTVGRRTGERHTAPMMFVPSPGGVYVVAANDGAPVPPNWFLNLRADPQVLVELPRERWEADARILEGEERASTWARLTADFPFFGPMEEKAGREIPVVELSRRASPVDAG